MVSTMVSKWCEMDFVHPQYGFLSRESLSGSSPNPGSFPTYRTSKSDSPGTRPAEESPNALSLVSAGIVNLQNHTVDGPSVGSGEYLLGSMHLQLQHLTQEKKAKP